MNLEKTEKRNKIKNSEFLSSHDDNINDNYEKQKVL